MNEFLYFSTFYRKKSLEISKFVSAFWILLVAVWEKNADFCQFRKDCVKLKGWNDIIAIKNSSRTSDVSLFYVTYITCYKKFVVFRWWYLPIEIILQHQPH